MEQRMTLIELIEGVERELEHRRGAYPRLVADDRMHQNRADYQISLMEDVLANLQSQLPPTPQQESLHLSSRKTGS
jgi:hypothetical protein